MAKRRALEETLAALRRLRQDPDSEASLRELRRVLEGEKSLAVAKAAALAGEFGLVALAPELTAAFDRFLADPVKTDPGCIAKTATVEALRRLDHDDLVLYRRGARHVQMEPVFGGRTDMAVDLRGASALALAEHGGSDVLVDLAELLADPEPPVRICAAHAVSVHGRDAGIPLLRFKALAGDPEPRVVSEALLALLRLDPGRSLPFVAGFLEKGAGPAEAATVALGESRLKEAFPVLAAWVDAAAQWGLRRVALGALATLRRDEAFDLLLSLVRDAPAVVAREALAALAGAGPHDPIHERATSAAKSRKDLGDAT